MKAFFALFTLGVAGVLSAATATAAAGQSSGQAEVISEQLTVHAEMSTTSRAVASLEQGRQVTVRLRMLGPGSDGPWCAISLHKDAGTIGYVQCKSLRQGEAEAPQWIQISGGAGQHAPSKKTRVRIYGNQVLVPVTLKYGWKSKEVQLMLDTGASQSVIDEEVAAALNIDTGRLKKAIAQVVGGALIVVRSARMDSVQVGPHTKEDMEIAIVEHDGPAVPYDGLLGMDFLRGLQYDINFDRGTINWVQRQ